VLLVDVAQDYARRGWPVFPLVPGRKVPRAELTQWEARATTDAERIARWWRRHPSDNVAVATGPAGLVVVDLDMPKPGQRPPERWAGARHGLDVFDQLAPADLIQCPTWTVTTPSGGRHRYYRPAAGTELGCTRGRVGWCIDTRGRGGYVVAAGSIAGGHRYELADDTPPAELPDWLARLADPPAPARPAGSTSTRPTDRRGYGPAALAAEVDRVVTAGPGARNEALRKAAWNLGRLVAAGQLARHDVETALQAAGEAAGYRDGPRAVAAVIRSSLDARLHAHRRRSA